MATITESEALQILSLERLRSELRIPDDSHDALLGQQIHSALAYISELTGRGSLDLDHPALKAAGVLLCRQLYDGAREIRPTAAFWSLLGPFRSYRPGKTTARLAPVVGDHTRYFGWSDDRVIATADFAAAVTSSANVGTLPQRSTNGYIWFAVPEAAGYPSSLHLNEGPLDQLGVFVRQAGTVDDANGDPHIVGVSFDIQGLQLSGQEVELGY